MLWMSFSPTVVSTASLPRKWLWVPIIRSWALTRGFALHPGTRNRYEIRYTRTQHRPPSRQVNDHGRVSGTHTHPRHPWRHLCGARWPQAVRSEELAPLRSRRGAAAVSTVWPSGTTGSPPRRQRCPAAAAPPRSARRSADAARPLAATTVDAAVAWSGSLFGGCRCRLGAAGHELLGSVRRLAEPAHRG